MYVYVCVYIHIHTHTHTHTQKLNCANHLHRNLTNHEEITGERKEHLRRKKDR
jgi:hypothetical protein